MIRFDCDTFGWMQPKDFLNAGLLQKNLAKNTNSDSFINKHLCGFGKGTKGFKFMAYHATRKFRKVAIKNKIERSVKTTLTFSPSSIYQWVAFTLFQLHLLSWRLQSVSKSIAYTMSFLYVRTQNTQQNWMVKESPLELNLIFSSSFCRCAEIEDVFFAWVLKPFIKVRPSIQHEWLNIFFIWKDMARNP